MKGEIAFLVFRTSPKGDLAEFYLDFWKPFHTTYHKRLVIRTVYTQGERQSTATGQDFPARWRNKSICGHK